MIYGETLSSLSANEVTTLRKPPGVWPPTCGIMRPQVPSHLHFPQSFLWKAAHKGSLFGRVPQPLGDIQCLRDTCGGLSPSHCQIFVPQGPPCTGLLQGWAGLGPHWGGRPPVPCLSHLLGWAQCCVGTDLYQLLTADCAHVFPTPCLTLVVLGELTPQQLANTADQGFLLPVRELAVKHFSAHR